MSEEKITLPWPEWQAEARLGKGSYGVVYRAVRRGSMVESYSAIKVISIPSDESEIDTLRAEGLTDAETKEYFRGIVEEFVSEIQVMDSLKGMQNIVSVEDYNISERENGTGWDISIRMELLTPFNTYAKTQTLTENDVIKLGVDICSALEICESRNIIHRDIKPENIFVNDFGCFKLGDFGIARKLENATGGMSQKGTYNYMAPEVMNGSKYDSRVDIYSLGLVLYRLLNANRLPFIDNDAQAVNFAARKMAVDRRLSGEQLLPPRNASPEMADLILRACAYNPNDRFVSASEMKNALMSIANGTYAVAAADVDGTIRVRRAQQGLDETIGVRRPTRIETPTNTISPSHGGAALLSSDVVGASASKKKSKVGVVLLLLLGLSIVAALTVGGMLLFGGSKEDDQPNDVYFELASTQVGDIVKFGLYEQDNDTSNGKEEIEWLVLEVKDGKALVISKYALDCKQYNTSYANITWETCTLRKWLNNGFIDEAFSADEKAMIPTLTVSADKNPSYNTNPGNATQDQVFLLSITEANKYFSSDSARQCKPTEYAVAGGAYVNSSNGNCWWWLRSPGLNQSSAAYVYNYGDVNEYGYGVSHDDFAVRPALWINLDS